MTGARSLVAIALGALGLVLVGQAPVAQADQASLSPQAMEWVQFLQGTRLQQLDRYSSDSGGIYMGGTSRRTMDVCSDGRFFYSDASSFGGGGGGVSAYGGGGDAQAGTWQVIEQGHLIGIELRWQDGSVSQHLLQYQNGLYIDGARTYRTFDNASCP